MVQQKHRNYTVRSNKAIIAAENPPAAGNVTTHEKMIFLNSDQSTLSFDLTRPTLTTEPTWQCVELTGMPTLDAKRTVRAAPSSMQNPLKQGMANLLMLNKLQIVSLFRNQ